MRKIWVILAIFILLPSVMAINLDVDKISSDEVYIRGISDSITSTIEITNLEGTDTFDFYNLLGFEMLPEGTVTIEGDSTERVELRVRPISGLGDKDGFYTFIYYIQNSEGEEQEEHLTFEIINLDEAFQIGSGDVNIDSNTIDIFIRNKKDFDFGELDVSFDSAFFETQRSLDLGPKETETFSVELNKDDFRKLRAGFYTLNAELTFEGETADIEGTIEFREKDLLTTTKQDYGFLVNTQIIEKSNEGNTLAESETVIKKNIISRLFTTLSPQPDMVERQGASVYYTWTDEIEPGEALTISVKTNWLFPFLVIFFIVAIIVLVKKYSGTDIVLRKRVSHVKAKGGEFALKVTIMIKAKNYLERVNIIDRLPPLVNVYERFGSEKPTRVDEKAKKIEWNFEKLEAGEIRVLSYVIFSKVGVMGKFALPTTKAIFEKEGEIHEAESNRAYFVTEPIEKDKPKKEDLE